MAFQSLPRLKRVEVRSYCGSWKLLRLSGKILDAANIENRLSPDARCGGVGGKLSWQEHQEMVVRRATI